MSKVENARKVIAMEMAEVQAMADRLGPDFEKAVELLRSSLANRGKVIVAGVGKSGHIGEKIAATLSSTGSPAVVLNSLNAMHGDLGVICDGDVVIALSYSGETEELVNILRALARFDVQIIAITGDTSSTLAKSSHAVLDVQVSREACPLNLAPTSSTTSMLVLGDALAMTLLEARGFKKEDFAKFHPGGQIGRTLLLKVDQIMRSADRLALVAPHTPILEVIQAMTAAHSGAAMVIEDNGRLAGIFTHGDFARHFPASPDIATSPVKDYMTKNPITVRSDRLAAEVLNILQKHHIDDLVVVDSEGRPVGMVDSQDLSRMKLL
jgi:arabinose-5-phosphate isomerase